jgi:hypothetical protein
VNSLDDLDVPLRMVMEILRHGQIATTADLYTHVMTAPYAEVDDALDGCSATTAMRRRPCDERRKVQREMQMQPVGCGSVSSADVFGRSGLARPQ